MFESKYNKVLTVILVIVIIAIIGLLAFLGYDYYQKYAVTQDASSFVENFQGEIADAVEEEQNTTVEENITEDNSSTNTNPFEQIENVETSGSSSSNKKTYKGFGVLGTIQIPKISLEYPILEKVTKKSIETAVAFLYGEGINQPGNSVIIGHNYRNGLFFSNNDKLEVGDKIYITDNDGKKLTYTIYNKFITTPEDTSFYQRDTAGKPEITLSTCTDDSKSRLIILAKSE